MMRCTMIREPSWDAKCRGVIAAQFTHRDGWNLDFTLAMLITGYSGLHVRVLSDMAFTARFSLTT